MEDTWLKVKNSFEKELPRDLDKASKFAKELYHSCHKMFGVPKDNFLCDSSKYIDWFEGAGKSIDRSFKNMPRDVK